MPTALVASAARRAYMPASNDGPTNAKATQTELELVLAGKTSFVTPRPALSDDTRIAQAFEDLRARIRSPTWRPSLLIVLGHDSAKRQDELEQRIREDEAAEVVDGELRNFFDAVLAPVMQDRETKLVNTMQECVQHELQTQQLVIQRQEKRLAVLTQQIEDWEKQVVHLKTKVDRRVNENNALRKEQYRQLLMLRDIVSKHSSEPGALCALNEAIATVLTGKQEGQTVSKTANGEDPDQIKPTTRGLNASTHVLQREKEKWEERAREASLESQELREKIAHLMQENKTYRTHATIPWFLDPESAIAERQRIAEAVCSSQGKWEDVGDALAELLNNDLLWAAVEQSARRGNKRRVARGLEAMLAQIDNREQTPAIQEDASPQDEVAVMPLLSRRRSTFAELRRLLPCRVCNGAGYVQSELGDNGASDSDSYLRKTLEQVLELKQQIEKTNTKALALEGELELARSHSAQLQERLLQAELVKSTAVDSCLQTDLDDEEGIDLDEIMRSAYGQDGSTPKMSPRQNRRNAQYEHLIVELKSTLADKDEGLAESRKALEVAQTRAVKLQRALQKEKDTHAQELAMLKTSLSFSLKSRNNKIEERQAAVKLLLRKFVKKTQQASLLRKSNDTDMAPMSEEGTGGGSDSDSDSAEENQTDTGDGALPELSSPGPSGEQREVKRMESLVQRYAEDIVRVRKEHEVQQELLKKAEQEIAEEGEKRSRTNSITQGSLVVSLASHPRDLFKALTTAQSDILALRRASQRSSALQTDRLLTLTTHLSHMSEELCTLRKRNLAEVEFWKLECEKLQNTNKALEAQQQLHQRELQATRDHHAELSGDAALGICSMCEKHKSRLMMISNQLLRDVQTPRTDPEVEVPIILTESERKTISSVLLDLESTYLGMSSAKQRVARELIAAHIGTSLTPRTTRSGKSRSNSKVMLSPIQDAGIGGHSPSPTKSVNNYPRKSMRSFRVSKSKRDLKKLTEAAVKGQDITQTSAQTNQTIPSQEHTNEQKANSDTAITAINELANVQEGVYQARHRKTLVQEILDEGGFTLTKHGLAIDTPSLEAAASSAPLDKATDNPDETRLTVATPSNTSPYDEAQDDQEFSNDDDLFPYEDDITLLECPPNTERDSDVIDQLRGLVNQASAAKERLAISGWKILISRILSSWTHQRLRQLKVLRENRVKTNADGTIRPKNHKVASICIAMEKAVKLREISLQESESTRESLRKFHRTAKARLIHGVSMLLENVSRHGKLTTTANGVLYIPQVGSPRRSPTSNRSLYPAATVHLNHVPPTQQIPTSTFPALTSSSSTSDAPLKQLTQNSSRYREGPEEGFSYGEGYHLPHRLIKSAGPRGMGSFVAGHSTPHTLLGSMPLVLPARGRHIGEQSGHIVAGNTAATSTIEPQRPVRPHSSPAGPRLLSTRLHELTSVANTRSSNTGDTGL